MGTSNRGQVRIDLRSLIVTRMLITGNSGAGKSRAVRRLIEQVYGKVQIIVFDPEDELYTLREKFDFVLAGGDDADCPAHPSMAEKFAIKVMELNISTIIGFGELEMEERQQFVYLFLRALMNVPKSIRRALLVVIDEADMYAPEGAKSDTAKAVMDLCVRGRKRSYCPILATQRPAMLSATVRGACVNKMVGRQSLDIDVERSSKDLGLQKGMRDVLRTLNPGQFFATGPAFGLTGSVELIQAGPVETTHPEPGETIAAPPPPRGEVAKILAQLSVLPTEDISQSADVSTLRARIKELEERPIFPQDKHVVELRLARTDGFGAGVVTALECVEDAVRALKADEYLRNGGDPSSDVVSRGEAPAPMPKTFFLNEQHEAHARDERTETRNETGISLNGPGEMQTNLLRALATFRDRGLTKQKIMVHTGYTASGHLSKTFAAVVRDGLAVMHGPLMRITEAGQKKLGSFTPVPVGRRLYESVLKGNRLNDMDKAMLRCLVEVGKGRVMLKREILEACKYTASGHASKAFARLVRYGYLVKSEGGLRLSGDLS